MIGSTSSGVLPGEEATVDDELAGSGDHVAALAGLLDHRRGEGEGEQRLDRLDRELVDGGKAAEHVGGRGLLAEHGFEEPGHLGPDREAQDGRPRASRSAVPS